MIEKIAIREGVNPTDGSRHYLCQFAVDGVPCIPFYDHRANKLKFRTDEEWIEKHLAPTAQELVKQYGPAPALT